MNFQVFPENANILPKKRVKFGIDPTSSRLHLGHFVPLRLLKKMLGQGHCATIVLGTFTAQLGDPSGRDTTRPILSEKEVYDNALLIKEQLIKILGAPAILQEDGQWQLEFNHRIHSALTVPHFMKLASQFTLKHMTSRNAFEQRIENNQSIALHELLVPICQGWDSVCLKAQIEIGGQDQLFNFQIARTLQEANGQEPQACILMPIINGTDGRKMSKSLGNCIFLDESPNDIFGKVMSISDEVMEEWFPLFIDKQFGILTDAEMHPMEKKKFLAESIVNQICSEQEAKQAAIFFQNTVQNKNLPEDIPNIAAKTLLDAVVMLNSCSKTAARQLLNSNAIKINGSKNQNGNHLLQNGDLIQVGKRIYGKILN